MGRYSFQTDDVSEAGAILQERIGATITHVGDRGGLRLTQATVGPMEVSRVAYGMDATVVAEPYPATFLQHVRSGRVRNECAQRDNRWAPGDIGVAVSPGFPIKGTCYEVDVDFVVIPPALFAEVAHTVSGTPPGLTSDHPVSAEAAAQWVRALAFVQQVVDQPDLTDLVAGASRRLLAAATLAAFPNDAALDPTIEDRRDAHPGTVRRAVAFIEAHPGGDITVNDIARAASVTPRALQLAFRRHLDTTPMGYLRQVRLELARRELQAGDPATLTVTTVAARWGFTSSWFAQLYRDRFGESPSQTLQPMPMARAPFPGSADALRGLGAMDEPVESAPPASGVIRGPVEDVHASLETSRIVGMAVGILMERHRLTAHAAFARLVQASRGRDVAIRAVAAELVSSQGESTRAEGKE